MTGAGGAGLEDVLFVERRLPRRGPMIQLQAVVGTVLLVFAVWVLDEPGWIAMRILCGLAAVLLVAPAFLVVETTVSASGVRVAAEPVWRRVIPLGDIVDVEVVIADHLVAIFGGWSARNDFVSAVVAQVEGDRSVGNRAVSLTLRDGRVRQVGSFRPTALVRAIEEAKAAG